MVKTMTQNESKDWNQLATDIENTVDIAYQMLNGLSEETISERQTPNAWSVKEMIGHLIDSASNNHQRFVRLQVSDRLIFPDYSQDNDAWVMIQNYQNTLWKDLLDLWRVLNLHLTRVIRNVNQSCLDNRWVLNEDHSITLGSLMIDYLRHMKDHLEEIRKRIEMNP